MVHVGVDLRKRVSQIAALSANEEHTQHRLENDRLRVQRFFAQVPAPARVAIEASGTWWWLVDLLEQLGPAGPLPPDADPSHRRRSRHSGL